jgi:hypothetical protein
MTAMLKIALFAAVLPLSVVGYAVADSQTSGAPCPVGESRTIHFDFPPKSLQPVTTPFVIGCVTIRGYGQLDLAAFRNGEGSLCVGTGFQPGWAQTCNPINVVENVHGLDLGSSLAGDLLHVDGFASLRVASVKLRYRSVGVVRRRRAALVRVTDPAWLGRLSLTKPFAYYAVGASSRARRVAIIARNKSGKVIFRHSLPSLGP